MIALLLLGALAPGPLCEAGGDPVRQRTLLLELNFVRATRGARPLRTHPALCSLASRRALRAASEGSVHADTGALQGAMRQLYRDGYAAHAWNAGTLIGSDGASVLAQWRSSSPDFVRAATAGDFEHAGLAVATRRRRPISSVAVALHKRTWAWRQAAPLLDHERTRTTMLDAVNRARRDHGVPPLVAHAGLDQAAQAHADDMLRLGFYAHQGEDGSSPTKRVRAAGVRGAQRVAENIAKGLFAPDEVVARWLRSSGHRANILHRSTTAIGIGIAAGDSDEANEVDVYWVQVFARMR